jgi:hypothetical protein
VTTPPDDPTAPVTADDLRERYAAAVMEHCTRAEPTDLDRAFASDIATRITAVRDEELERLRAERGQAFASNTAAIIALEAHVAEVERLRAERDHWKREHDELKVVWAILAERTLIASTLVADDMRADVEAELAPIRLDVLRKVLAGEAGRDDLAAALLPQLAEAERRYAERTDAMVERLRAELDAKQEAMDAARFHLNMVTKDRLRWEQESLVQQRRAEQAEAERDALKCAIYDTRTAHIRECHATKLVLPSCAVCCVFLALSRAMPAGRDDLDEIRRRLGALDTAPETRGASDG